MGTIWEIAKQGIFPGPLGKLVVQGVELAAHAVSSASDRGVEALSEEVAKQQIRLGFELRQAKIAQELAISERISNAEVVEIEEFYDVSASAHAGVQMGNGNVVTLGLGADGKGVTKRIYQFKGFLNGEIPLSGRGMSNDQGRDCEPKLR